MFTAAQPTGAGDIAGEKDRHRQLQITEQLTASASSSFNPSSEKCPTRRQRLVENPPPIRSIISDACSAEVQGHLTPRPPAGPPPPARLLAFAPDKA